VCAVKFREKQVSKFQWCQKTVENSATGFTLTHRHGGDKIPALSLTAASGKRSPPVAFSPVGPRDEPRGHVLWPPKLTRLHRKGYRKMKFSKFCAGLFVFTMVFAVVSASAVCSNASLNGVVGYSTTAWAANVGYGGASVGQITYDGKGNFTAAATDSAYGTIESVTYSGTYSVAKDCTGTNTITTGPMHGTFNFVFDGTGKNYQAIETDGTYIASGFAIPQGKVTCGLTGKKQTFALNVGGTDLGVGPVVGVGQLTLNGSGSLSGSATFNVNGTLTSGSVTGTYTADSNCTGTAQITVAGALTYHYSLVVVDSGKEMLVVETDNNTVVTGTMQ
jgi:hypothetical protein